MQRDRRGSAENATRQKEEGRGCNETEGTMQRKQRDRRVSGENEMKQKEQSIECNETAKVQIVQ
jgi:hypothetical protein